jgi:Ca2+/Na+ antiporter
MSLKRYQNEMMLVLAAVFLLVAFMYKQTQRAKMSEANQQMAKEITVFQETVNLKKIWADKKIPKKLEAVQKLVPGSKVKWRKKGKKLTASFTDMLPSDINKVVTKILNIAVELESITIEQDQSGKHYKMEIRCKW